MVFRSFAESWPCSCGVLALGWLQRGIESLHIPRHHVALEVYPVPGFALTERGALEGLGDERNLERRRVEIAHGEADAVDRDGAALDDQGKKFSWGRDAHAAGEAVLLGGGDLPDAVDVALDDVAAEAVRCAQCQLQVHG